MDDEIIAFSPVWIAEIFRTDAHSRLQWTGVHKVPVKEY